MIYRILTLWLVLVSLSATAQGPVRYVDTLDLLLRQNPIPVATGGAVTYEVARRSTNDVWGSPRTAVWTPFTNAVPNGTNIFASPFGGRWIFWDKDDPIQNAAWYRMTNRWRIDHLGNLVLGTTNVAGDLSDLRSRLNDTIVDLEDYSLIGHDHPVVDIRDSTAISRAIIQTPTASGIRGILLLGDSATRNVGATAEDVAQGDHNHNGVYDLLGTAVTLIDQHRGETNPHPVYILGNAGRGTNISLVGGIISGDWSLSLGGGDINSGGDHRLLIREVSTGNWKTMDLSFFKGWLDLHASNIVDAGATGIQLVQSATKTNALDALGTGRSGSLFLRGDGTWSTAISTNALTNSLPEAPNDGTAYARKNLGWTGLAIADVSGLSSFGQSWVALASPTQAVSTLRLTGTNTFTLDSAAKYSVRANSGGSASTRHRLNIIPGTSIGVLLSDDSVDDEADVTLYLTNLLSTQIVDSTAQGRGLLTNSTAAGQRTVLGLGTVATLNVAVSGNAATNEVVKGNDTRLSDARTPASHTHPYTEVVSVPEFTVLGKTNSGTGAAQAIPFTNLVTTLKQNGLGTGNVASVGLSMPSQFTVSGSPLTNSGTIAVTLATQATNLVFASPAGGTNGAPAFRRLTAGDLPSEAWTVFNDGPLSGLDSDTLDQQHGTYYLSRGNHVGTQPWNTISSTPVTYTGYGITNVADLSDFRSHTNLTVTDGSHVHGFGTVGGIVAQAETYPDLYDRLQINSGAFLFAPVPGSNAVVDPSHGVGWEAEIVTASDTRLTNARVPSAHGHVSSGITNVASQTVIGRLSPANGNAEEIPLSTLAAAVAASGGGPTGTVTRVAFSAPQSALFSVSGSPITNTGTISLSMNQQNPHTFLAGGVGDTYQFPTFRAIDLTDLPGNVWTSENDGSSSTLDAGLFAGNNPGYYLNRTNHSGTQSWSTLFGTPTTLSGYGITDALPLSGGTLTGTLTGPYAAFTNGVSLLIPLRTEADYTSLVNLTTQSGMGAGDLFGWTYPYGTKLTINNGVARAWELMNTTYPDGSLAHRIRGASSWSTWKVLLDGSNYTNYAPTKAGVGASGTWTVNITGGANYATNTSWTGISGTPTTKSGYGITDVPTYTDLAAHTNLTTGAHGMTAFGAGLVDDANAAAGRTTLGLGTSATLDVAASGDASAGQVVKGNDTRLTDSRTPLTHTHTVSQVSDSGTTGRLLVQSEGRTNALDVLGTGRSASLFLRGDGTWTTVPSSGDATNGITEAPTNSILYGRKNAAWTQVSMADITGMSVGLAVPGPFSVSGSPVTSSGTLTLGVSNQTQKTFWAGPVSGSAAAPTFRVIAATDLPSTVWTSDNDGTGSGLDAGLLGGQLPAFYLQRSNHTGNVPWTNVTGTPTTLSGYGITNAVSKAGDTMTGTLTLPQLVATNGAVVEIPPRAETAFNPPTGLTYQEGPGASNEPDYGWTYPYGAKLTVWGMAGRAWEFGNTTYPDGAMAFRIASMTNWSPWRVLVDAGNYTNYTVTKTGEGATGTWPLNITGSSGFATNTTWAGVSGTPTTRNGYGITDVPLYSDLAAHTNLTTGAHGMTTFGASLVDDANAAAGRTTLGLGTSATLNVAASGNAASGEVVKGNDTRLSDARTPTTHTHPFSDVTSTPTTLVGYGITNAAELAEFKAHTNLTTAHGISAYGATLVDDTSSSAARTTLGLGTSATLNVAASGNAASGEVVKGDDSRLTDTRTPVSHGHQSGDITNVAQNVVLGRTSPGTGAAEQIPITNLLAGVSLGTVTSVGLTAPPIFNVVGSPITSSGTINLYLASQAPNTIFAGPASGTNWADPSMRAMALADLPAGVWTINNDGTGSGLSADNVDGFDSTSLLARANHTGTQPWTTISTTPNTLSGYGITNGATLADLAAHASTTTGVHGISSFGATLVDDVSAPTARATLGLGSSAILNVAASGNAGSTEVVKGNDTRLSDARTPLTHNHDSLYDPLGAATNVINAHVGAGNPHSQYVLASGGSANSLSISGNSSLSGNVSLSLSDTVNSASHRFIIRDAVDGLAKYATISWAKGMLDYHIADIVDSGAIGQDLVKAATVGAALDRLGTGRGGGTSLFLREDGVWATPPSGGAATNGIGDAPTNGVAYVRKDGAWTGLSINDVGGVTGFGQGWLTSVGNASAALTTLGLTGGGATTIDSPAKHNVRANSSGSGTPRHRLNVSGTTVSVGLADDSVDDESDLTLNVADGYRGDLTISGNGMVYTITNGGIGLSKIQNISSSTLLGRGSSGGSGSPQVILPGQGLVMSGTSLNVDPSTFISGQILFVTGTETELSSPQLVANTWYNVLGAARSGTSKTIPAGALTVGSVLKIELYGDFGATDVSSSGVGKLRVTIGSNFSAVMEYSNELTEVAPDDTPWSATITLSMKSANAVRASGTWRYSNRSGPPYPTSGFTYEAKAVPTGTIDLSIPNTIGADFYGKSGGETFTQFRCNNAIVTRY